MNTNQQGTLAEISTVKSLVQDGFDVFLPFNGKTQADILAFKDGIGIISIQVKSTTQKTSAGSYIVELKSNRPNRTQSNIKKFDNTRQDILSIYIVELDTIVFILSSSITTTSQLRISPIDAINLAEKSLTEIITEVLAESA